MCLLNPSYLLPELAPLASRRRRNIFSISWLGVLLALAAQAQPTAPGPTPNRELDSLRQVLPRVTGRNKVDVLYSLARHSLPDKDQTLRYANQSLALARQLNYPTGISKAHFCSSLAYLDLGEYDSALVLGRRSLKVAEKHGIQQLLGWNYNTMGEIHQRQGRFLEARAAYLQAEKAKEALGDLKGSFVTAYNLAQLNLKLNYHEDAVRYFHKAEHLSRKLGRETVARFIEPYGLAQVRYAQRRYREALALYLQAAGLIDATRGVYDFSKSYLLSKTARTYLALQDFPRALTYYQKALREKPDTEEQAAEDQVAIARIYRETAQPAAALKTARQALTLARHMQDDDMLAEVYAELAQASVALGQFQQAADFYAAQLHYQDKAYDTNKAKEFARLQVAYETERKARQIAALESENQLQKLRAEKQAAVLLGASVGAGLLLFVLLLLANRYRLKQRANRRLEIQQVAINQQNRTLGQLLYEKEDLLVQKELLLKEIHHRVKNNLQMVMGLLRAQAANLQDRGALLALQESQARVQAISLIHQFLYQAADLSQLEMDRYVRTLVSYLNKTLGRPGQVSFELTLNPVQLDVDTAIPLGLILNEIITNALKYAFGNSGSGVVRVHLQQVGGQLHLEVADNGIGLPAGFAPEQSASMGLQLVYGLAHQLQAHIQFVDNGGCQFRLRLPVLAALYTAQPTAELTNP